MERAPGAKIRPRLSSRIALRSPVDPRLVDRVWQVWVEGGHPVGPVSADQVARGIRSGKVPTDARVKHATETFWCNVLDAADIISALKGDETPLDVPAPGSLEAKHFMVWTVGKPVGPVSANQIARGIRAKKVPTDASIQRVGDLFATGVLEEPDVIAALKRL
jgi:hypothetical protein